MHVHSSDVQIGAGPSNLMEMVNVQGQLFSKHGTPLTAAFDLSDFFHAGRDFISDPKITFDMSSGRWFASILDSDGRHYFTRTSVIFAVSSSPDPVGIWKIYNVTGSLQFPDQPRIGTSDDKFVISTNDFSTDGTSFLGAHVWVFNKNELITGSQSVAYASYGPTATLASVHQVARSNHNGVHGHSRSRHINVSRQDDAPLPQRCPTWICDYNVRNYVDNPGPSRPPDPGGNLISAIHSTQVTTAYKTLCGRMEYSGTVSTSRAIPPAGIGFVNNCIRLTQIDTGSMTVLHDFDIADLSRDDFYPALSMDSSNNLVVVYAQSNGFDIYPSLLVTGQAVSDPSNTLRQPVRLRDGTASDKTGRYGDYFGASTDPSDQTLVWVAGEYHDNAINGLCGVFRQVASCWSTFIAGARAEQTGFSLGIDPPYLTLRAGTNASITTTTTSAGGFAGTVSLNASDAGAETRFTPRSVLS
ncbi:MAG TPA: hypothetical protein VFE98_00865 [Candidatus Bathyarchaeia archaeon]|nr:hypothetical protein [Candidatus Bathyarchaeia archaeon]